MNIRGWLSTKEVSQMTGYAEDTIRHLRLKSNPDFPPYFKHNGKVSYRKCDVEAWMRAKESCLITGA